MRWINRAIALTAVITLSAVAAWAQTQECTDDFKTATYSKWYENVKTDQEVAYKAAVEYLTVCPNEPADNPYANALKKFKKDYEDLVGNKKLAADFEAAVKSNNYAEQVRLGKQLTVNKPDNTIVYIFMANAGINDANVSADALQAAKKAIELIEGGKPFAPAYPTKDQALASMNYVIAKLTAKSSPTDAIPYFVKAAKYEGPLKKDPRIYNELAAAYAEQVAKLTEDYKAYVGKPETTESKLVLANLNQAMDAQIDALARATALADAANKPALLARLTDVYKDRNHSDTGLNDLVTGVLAKPLPDAPKPITELPTPPTPSPTPGGTSATPTGSAPTGSAPGNGASSTSNTAKPSTTGTPTTSSSKPATSGTTTPAKPTASPTPKPRQRRANHRGR
ncbi:MAG TPA: hypothetical protein VGJ69_05235 [Pyrinomonadaceae bacterium]|jgi:hypothetical protein